MNKFLRFLVLNLMILCLGVCWQSSLLAIPIGSGTFEGGFGWQPIDQGNGSRAVTVWARAMARSDFHIGLKYPASGGAENWVEFVIGGWSNSHSAVRRFTKNTPSAAAQITENYDLPAGGAYGTGRMPSDNSYVDYRLTVVNGTATLRATSYGQTSTVLVYSSPLLSQTFTDYSFHAHPAFPLFITDTHALFGEWGDYAAAVAALAPPPPPQYPSLAVGDVITLTSAYSGAPMLLGLDPVSNCIAPLQTSSFDPATHFIVKTYNSSAGHVTLGIGTNSLVVDSSQPAGFFRLKSVPSTTTETILRFATGSAGGACVAGKFALLNGVDPFQVDPRNPATAPLIFGVPYAQTPPASYSFAVSAPLTAAQKALDGLTVVTPSTAATQVSADLANKFTLAFGNAANTAADWTYLVSTLNSYVAQAVGVSAWVTGPLAVAAATNLYQTAFNASATPAATKTAIQTILSLPITCNTPAFNQVMSATAATATNANVYANLQTIDAEFVKASAAAVTDAQWLAFANAIVRYLGVAASAPAWGTGPIAVTPTTRQPHASIALPGYAAVILGRIVAASSPMSAAAKAVLSPVLRALAPLTVGSKVALNFNDWSYLMVDPASGALVAGPSSSILDPAVHFTVSSYTPETSLVTLSSGSRSIIVSGTTLQATASGAPAEPLTFVYNTNTEKFSLRTSAGVLQKNGTVVSLASATSSTPANSQLGAFALNSVQLAMDAASPAAGLSLATFVTDLTNSFTVAYRAGGKNARDWSYLFSALAADINAVSSLSGFTAPGQVPAGQTVASPSPRDNAVGLLNTVLLWEADAPTKAAALALKNALVDMPVFLADPTTPPPALTLNVNDVFALNLAGSTYLTKSSATAMAAAATSFLNPAARFTVQDYNKTTGRISIGVGSSYLRLSNDATSFVITGTKRFIDVARDATNASKFKLSYNGAPASLSAANLGSSAPSFTVVALSAIKIAFGDLSLIAPGTALTKDAVLAGLHTIDACYKELQDAAKVQAASVTSEDWLFFANTINSYLQVACLVPEWSVAAALPTTATQITAPASLADYASSIYLRIIASESLISAGAKTALMGVTSLYSIANAGDLISLKFADGSCLVTDATSNLLKPMQTSTLNNTARFTLASYNKMTGDFTLNAGSNPVCADTSASPNKLIARAGGTAQVFKSTYDVAAKTFSFGFGGNVVQKNFQVDGGPVLVTSSANLESASYLFSFNMVQVGSRAQGNAANGDSAGSASASGPLTLNKLQSYYRPLFLSATNAAIDWRTLVIEQLAEDVVGASVLPGWTTPGAVQGSTQSLRDIASSMFQLAVNSATADAETKATAQNMIAWLADQPIFLADPTTPPASLAVNANDIIALKVSDGVYLGLSTTGTVGASPSCILDPTIHFVVSDYNKATGRICLASGSSYLRLSPDATSFVLTGTKRFVDIVRDTTNPALFSFSYAGTVASFTPQSLGLPSTVTTPVTQFTAVGALSAAQTVLDGLGLYASATLTPASVQDDITRRLDPAFAALGTIPGDWGLILKTLVSYAARVARDIPTSQTMNVVSANGATSSTMTFKDYIKGNINTRFGELSAAPADIKVAAASAVAQLDGRQVGGSNADLVLTDGCKVLMRIPNADYTSSTLLSVNADGSVQAALATAQCLPSVHITVAKYDATANTVKLSYAGKFFDKATGKFSAASVDAASALKLDQTQLSNGSKYYYLEDEDATKRLALSDAQPAVVSFGARGTMFSIALSQAADSVLIDMAVPVAVADIEQAFSAYYTSLDAVKTDGTTLAGVASMFKDYCLKASAVAGWGTPSAQLSNSAPRDYARSILGLILTDPTYTGASSALKGQVTTYLAGAQFNEAASSGPAAPAPTTATGQPAYASLNGKTGVLASDIPVFDAALQAAGNSAEDLTTVLAAVTTYINDAATRVDWSPLEAASGAATPMSLCVNVLSGIKTGAGMIYSGVTPALVTQITGLIAKASDLSSAYSTHIAALDGLALALTDAASLASTNPLSTRLSLLVPKIASQGTADQRKALLDKLETYFDRPTVVPALRRATDAQKDTWALAMFGFEQGVAQFDATTSVLLTEKLGYLNDVCTSRLTSISSSVQTDAINLLFDPCLKKLSAECVALVAPTPSYSNATSTKDAANCASIQTFLNSLGGVLQTLNVPATDAVAVALRTVWFDAGLKPQGYINAPGSAAQTVITNTTDLTSVNQNTPPPVAPQNDSLLTGGV